MTTQILLIDNMADVKVFHLAFCETCNPVTPQPFTNADDRDVWSTKHLSGTGHRSTFKTEIRIVTP